MMLFQQNKPSSSCTIKTPSSIESLKQGFPPNCSLMEASNYISMSYAWRSILRGRDVIQRGARWRIGCGDSVNIWMHAWLPSLHQPQVQSPIIEGCKNLKVSALINPTSRCWDNELLHGSFVPHEASIIQSIPICHTNMEDKLFWPFMKSGVHSIKSGYQFLIRDASQYGWSQNDPMQTKEVWKDVQSINVLPKVRNFLWRACKEAILVKKNFYIRKVHSEDRCDHCKQASEDVVHAFWTCVYAKSYTITDLELILDLVLLAKLDLLQLR